MAQLAGHGGAGIEKILRVAFWSAAALLLLAPLVAMRFTNEVRWDETDFIFAALLLGLVGVAFEVTMRMTRSWTYRFAAGFAVAGAFLIVWANGAVGMIGNEDNPYNLYFLGVIGLALLGAIVARFRAGGMAIAMLAAGVAHAAIALGGSSADRTGALFSLGFAFLWLLSAALFRKASQDGATR